MPEVQAGDGVLNVAPDLGSLNRSLDNAPNIVYLDSRAEFREVSKNPQPNTTYEFDEFSYRTDELGRGVSTSGQLRLGAGGNRFYDDRLIGHQGIQDDIAFHAGADEFGFQVGALNLSPGNKSLNIKEYRALERDLKSHLQEGSSVEADFQSVFDPDNKTIRPDKYIVEYRVNNGRWRTRTFFNREGG
ncbi:DNA/RNA non-specific endonuclease [Vibrio penaeicida]|nr:DNA/RNA non-specific endonuclease [Vibrio penaeicida]MDP2571616.1 DNA/RNA non-specific endonuclease [Vibrio penaeicida]